MIILKYKIFPQVAEQLLTIYSIIINIANATAQVGNAMIMPYLEKSLNESLTSWSLSNPVKTTSHVICLYGQKE